MKMKATKRGRSLNAASDKGIISKGLPAKKMISPQYLREVHTREGL